MPNEGRNVQKDRINPAGSWWERIHTLPSTGIVIAGIVLSLFHGLFFYHYPESVFSNVGILLGVVNILLAIRYLVRCNSDSRWLLFVLLFVQFEILWFTYREGQPPSSLRLLEVGIITVYGATFVGCLLAWTKILRPLYAFLLVGFVSIGIFAFEISLEGAIEPKMNVAVGDPEPSITVESHPSLGHYFKPYTVGKTFYPSNPRGYFKEDIQGREWQFYVHEGNDATLTFPSGQPQSMRIDITKAATNEDWHINLLQIGFTFKADQPYVLKFLARADQTRQIDVGITQNYAPWDSVGGAWQIIELTPEWQPFQIEFVPKMNESRARLVFSLGTNENSVELTKITLSNILERTSEKLTVPKRYYVNYRLNGLGCRGRDYEIPTPERTFRIVLLGDSNTLGFGVHEEDILGSQLEKLLNENRGHSGIAYEVISCGVSGHGTREKRIFYQNFVSQYEPHLVVLPMMWNNNVSGDDEVYGRTELRKPRKSKYLFRTWSHVHQFLLPDPAPDFSASLQEVLQLRHELERENSRLAIMFFRDLPSAANATELGKIWTDLISTVTQGVEKKDIPVLDLQKSLIKQHSHEDSVVDKPLDLHPNEIAHGIAARELAAFLKQEKLLPMN